MNIDTVATVMINELASCFKNSKFYQPGDNLYRLFPETANGSYEWLSLDCRESEPVGSLEYRVLTFLESIGIENILVCVLW